MQTALAGDMIWPCTQVRPISELDDIDALVRTYRVRLLRFVAFSIKDADAAASIVQDCFLKAYKSRDQFRNDCSVSTWLTTIAVNQIRDYQRVKKYQFWQRAGKTALDVMEMASVLPNNEISPERRLLAHEQAKAVAVAVDTLSDRQRTVFLLRFQEDMELSEIARATGMPVNTIKTHLHRALKAVRERLGEANHD